MIKAQQIRWGE